MVNKKTNVITGDKLIEMVKNLNKTKIDRGAFRRAKIGNYRENIANGVKKPEVKDLLR
jgi:hypothetical protein